MNTKYQTQAPRLLERKKGHCPDCCLFESIDCKNGNCGGDGWILSRVKKRDLNKNLTFPITTEEKKELEKYANCIHVTKIHRAYYTGQNIILEYSRKGISERIRYTVSEFDAVMWFAERFNIPRNEGE